MAELKTKVNDESVKKFLKSVNDPQQQKDSFAILELMKEITKEEPKMWGTSIVGFGSYKYKSEKTGRGGDWFLIGFSPRKQNLTIYTMAGTSRFDILMKKLGKYKSTGSCLYIKKLEDIDQKILKKIIAESVKYMKSKKWD